MASSVGHGARANTAFLQVSMQSILNLQKGDRVNIVTSEQNFLYDELYVGGTHFTQFNGMLMEEDL